jgi:uncharacterized PurR-regulated membrane protein YhhQ (DUF165 family)
VFWILAYPLLIVVVNVLFVWGPSITFGSVYLPLASILVGGIFAVRDRAQDVLGHRVLIPMILAAVLSFALASPAVAFASLTAFAVSETADWIGYTFWPGKKLTRSLFSNLVSVPLDSVLFVVLAFPTFSWASVGVLAAVKVSSSFAASWFLLRRA